MSRLLIVFLIFCYNSGKLGLRNRYYIGEVEYSGCKMEKHHDPTVSVILFYVIN